MTLQDLAWSLGQVAVHHNPINGFYGCSSIGQLNTEQLTYPALALVPSGDIIQRNGFSEYNMTFYVVDRLLTDNANDFDIYSFSVETLKNFFKQLKALPGMIKVTDEPVIRLFHNERNNDRVCGAYATVALSLEDIVGCTDWAEIQSGVTPVTGRTDYYSDDYTLRKITDPSQINSGGTYVLFCDNGDGTALFARQYKYSDPDVNIYPVSAITHPDGTVEMPSNVAVFSAVTSGGVVSLYSNVTGTTIRITSDLANYSSQYYKGMDGWLRYSEYFDPLQDESAITITNDARLSSIKHPLYLSDVLTVTTQARSIMFIAEDRRKNTYEATKHKFGGYYRLFKLIPR